MFFSFVVLVFLKKQEEIVMVKQETDELFDNVKVGDKLLHVMGGFKGKDPWENEAKVIKITEKTIICLVFVDQPRRMEFDRQTGVNVDGREFGWLKLSKGGSNA